MKKLVLALGLMVASTFAVNTVIAQGTTPVKVAGAEITLDKDVHNYGKIAKSSDGACYFTITNTGNEPLLITRAKGSCGCTVPEWPREAIAPGETAKMKVTYATNRVGKINKSVTITSNATNAPTKVVRIKGEVLAAGKTPAKIN